MGFEPMTSCLLDRRSNQLSYGPPLTIGLLFYYFQLVRRMRSTSYRELWTNVSLDRWAVNLIVKSISSTSSQWMPNSYGFYRKAENVEVRFYGMVNAHIASEMI